MADGAEPPKRKPTLFDIPPDSRCDNCRSCRAIGYWITTGAGKALFVEVDHANPDERVPTSGTVGRGQAHFATCPDADRWRKKKPAAGR